MLESFIHSSTSSECLLCLSHAGGQIVSPQRPESPLSLHYQGSRLKYDLCETEKNVILQKSSPVLEGSPGHWDSGQRLRLGLIK